MVTAMTVSSSTIISYVDVVIKANIAICSLIKSTRCGHSMAGTITRIHVYLTQSQLQVSSYLLDVSLRRCHTTVRYCDLHHLMQQRAAFCNALHYRSAEFYFDNIFGNKITQHDVENE